MSQPTAYTPRYSFIDFQTSNPNSPLPADKVDAEHNAIKATTDGVRANLALIQRDDGKLANASVTPDSMTSAALALMAGSWTPRGAWVTATAYAVSDVVSSGGSSYVCAVAHAAGTFATDLAAGKWILMGVDAAAFTAVNAIGDEVVALAAVIDELLAVYGDSAEIQALGALSAELAALYAALASINTVIADTIPINALAALTAEITALAALATEIATVAGDTAAIAALAALTTEIGALGALVTEIAAVYAALTEIQAIGGDADVLAGLAAVGALGAVACDIEFEGGYGDGWELVNLETGGVLRRGKISRPCEVDGLLCGIVTQAEGAAVTLELTKNGTSVWSALPQFDAESSTLTAGTLKTDGTQIFAAGDIYEITTPQVGSSVPGQGLDGVVLAHYVEAA